MRAVQATGFSPCSGGNEGVQVERDQGEMVDDMILASVQPSDAACDEVASNSSAPRSWFPRVRGCARTRSSSALDMRGNRMRGSACSISLVSRHSGADSLQLLLLPYCAQSVTTSQTTASLHPCKQQGAQCRMWACGV